MSTHPPRRSTGQSDLQPTEDTVTANAPLVFGTYDARRLPNVIEEDDEIAR